MMKRKRRIVKSYFIFACRQYAPLIQKLAFRIGTNKTQVEELKVRGMEELLRCMVSYNGSSSFMTFFFGRLTGIFRHVRDAERRAKRIQNVPLDSMIDIAGPDCDIDCRMIVQECLEYLNDKERAIITELFLNGKTIREVSSESDNKMVPSTVCRVKMRAIDKMKQRCIR